MKRSSGSSSTRRKPAGIARKPDPEVVGFIAALLRQMDHAADLVIAFFRSLGMLGPDQTSPLALPREFLLELAALLQLCEWEAGGVIEWFDSEGLSLDDRIGRAIKQLADDPACFIRSRRGTQAITDVVRYWNESCCLVAREHLGCDVALHWDSGLDIDQIVDVFASFLCRHSHTLDLEKDK